MNILVTIGGADVSGYVALPIKWNTLLDERLDEGRISLRKTPTELYKIGAEVQITVDGETQDFIISADESTETPAGSGIYSHEISIIEPTKILEGIVVESLTFTNALGRNYTANVTPIAVNHRSTVSPLEVPYYISRAVLTEIENSQTPKAKNTSFRFPSLKELFKPYADNISGLYPKWKKELFKVTYNGDLTIKEYSDTGLYVPGQLDDGAYFAKNLGVGYYSATYQVVLDRSLGYFEASFTFVVVEDYEILPPWNIKSVAERVLNLTEPHLINETPFFKLDPEQVNLLESIKSPEFAFTKKTLKEIFDAIGGYIHGVPRLIRGESGKLDTIHFDLLGGTEKTDILSQPYVSQVITQNIEDYATALDSSADNLVTSLSPDEGAVVEPFSGGAKTPRSEQLYARIEENNLVISTTMPIYTLQKLEYIDSTKTYDITAYVFEATEYGRMSSYDSTYPTSKAFAIYFEQGKQNIKGLMFKPPKASTVGSGSYAQIYSIVRILKAVGANVSAFGEWGNTPPYPTMKFRVTYTPIFSTRTIQHKTYTDNPFKRVKIYNQSANIIETRYYGENMKGAIDRMGNAELVRTYRNTNLAAVPKIGQVGTLGDIDYYISSVTAAIYPESVNFTVGFSKDFNRLSQYIGVDSEWRAYEISEKRAYRREIVWEDFLIFNSPTDDVSQCLIDDTAGVIAPLCNFEYSTNSNVLTVVQLDFYWDGSKSIILPVVSTAFGAAISFTAKCEDNYSAGPQSESGNYEDGKNTITGYWNTDVPYTDYYGRAKTLEIAIADDGTQEGNSAFNLPDSAGTDIVPDSASIKTITPIEIDKDGGEAISFTYQLNFVSGDPKLIIGAALAQYCPFVRANVKGNYNFYVYALNKEVGRFDKTINTGTDVNSTTTFTSYTTSDALTTVAPLTGKAWALACAETGEILLARNGELNNEKVTLSYKFTHKRG